MHFVGLFFVFIIENARSKKQNKTQELNPQDSNVRLVFIVLGYA